MSVRQWKRIALCLAMGGLVLVGLVLLLGNARGVSYADGGVRYVAPGGTDLSDCKSIANVCRTVQHAIDVADSGDTIWVAQGTYTSTGLSVITVTKTITLYGGWDGATAGVRDPETYPTVLDGEGQRRVVYISGSVSPTVDGFIITRGNASHAPLAYRGLGGGICNLGATSVIANNVITNNVAYTGTDQYGVGGGIYFYAPSSAVITGNQVLSNVASTI